ncbi:MAG: hypothetical protein V3R84_08930 [Acidimicrobiia bacterium]
MFRLIAALLATLSLMAACGDTATTTSALAPLTTATTAVATTAGPATTQPAPTVTTTAPTTAAPTTTTTTPLPTTTTLAGPSAADDLAAFFTAAERLDVEISEAATLFNAGFDADAGTLSIAAQNAIAALSTAPITAVFPAGLDVDLETAVLAVYADLESRIAALDGGGRYLNFPPGVEPDVEFTMLCLGLGSDSNARFDDDLAAARVLAALSPRPTAADDSAEAGILAVRIETIRSMNWGCDSCGGVVITDPIPVDWEGQTVVDGVGFDSTFVGGSWDILIYAC